MVDLLGWMIAGFLVLVTVGIHYEIMRVGSDIVLPWALRRFHDRRVMLLMMISLLLGHILEIWFFALAMWGVSQWPELGSLSGHFDGRLGSFVYFSAVNYTSLGYGDVLPHGAMRSIAVSETLTGLLMIAWSASFTYLKMEQVWNRRQRSGNES